MKALILTVLLILGALRTFGQDHADSVKLLYQQDEMDGSVIYFPDTRIVLIDSTNFEKGIGVSASLSKTKMYGINTKMIGLGGCNENDKLIILLENGNKINLTSWQKFDCEGISYFSLTNSQISMLSNSPVAKIRLTNGVSNDSFTGTVPVGSRNYFINVMNRITGEQFTEYKP